MKKKLLVYCLLLFTLFSFNFCSKKGEAIIEPRIGSYKFTTYTTDTFRFSIIVNDQLLSDSLLSPVGTITRTLEFTTDTVAKLRIINAVTNQLYVDSTIKLRTGLTTFSIVQLVKGQTPSIAPLPNEALPATGYTKVRFQYIQPTDTIVPFFDSIQCIVRRGAVSLDTVVLERYEFTRFYEVPGGSRFTILIKDPLTGEIIHNGSSATITANSGFTEFNTTVLFGIGGIPGAYSYRITRIY